MQYQDWVPYELQHLWQAPRSDGRHAGGWMGRMTTMCRLIREGDPVLQHFAAFALSRIEQQQVAQRGEVHGKWLPKVKLLCTLVRDGRMDDAHTMADMIMFEHGPSA